jgi:four helix bundle protein
MTYESDLTAWEATVPDAIRRDALWRMRVYRLALYASDRGWEDVLLLAGDPRMRGLSDQLYRALGSIGANLVEGYSRSTGRDRARFYTYALGSARESRDWYYKARFALGEELAGDRMRILSEVVRQLLSIISAQPGHLLREPVSSYRPEEVDDYLGS